MAGNRYYRCRQDKSGCEPKRLFTLAEFMIYDKDGSGTVNEDECMEMMCGVCAARTMNEKM